HVVGDLPRVFVLPVAHDAPAAVPKRAGGFKIARLVSLDLLAPPHGVVSRRNEVLGTPVPEASVDVDSDLHPREDDVRLGLDVRLRPVVDAVAKPDCVHQPTNPKFGFGACGPLRLESATHPVITWFWHSHRVPR